MKAPVRKIIAQSTVDGPGNRTAVFLQGCNIRCAYCHNPETQAMHDAEAKETDTAEVLEEIRKGIPFTRGITVSGGECMLHQEWMLELFRSVHALDGQLSCLIDSNGTVPFYRPDGTLTELAEEADGVMLDVKAWDAEIWHKLTGYSSNETVKKNLKTLLEADKITEVRVVCLPKEAPVTTDEEAILEGIRQTADKAGKPMPKVHLITFRPHGVIGVMADAPMTPDKEMARYEAKLQELQKAEN